MSRTSDVGLLPKGMCLHVFSRQNNWIGVASCWQVASSSSSGSFFVVFRYEDVKDLGGRFMSNATCQGRVRWACWQVSFSSARTSRFRCGGCFQEETTI